MVDDFHKLDSFWSLYWSLIKEKLGGNDVSNEKYILNFHPQAGFFFLLHFYRKLLRSNWKGFKEWRKILTYSLPCYKFKRKQSDLAVNKSNDYTTFSKCMNCIYFTASYGLFYMYLLKSTCTVQTVCYVFSQKQM